MGSCKRIKFEKTKVCFGDYRHPIIIASRDISAPEIGTMVASEVFEQIAAPFAAVKTMGNVGTSGASGVQRFGKININPKATHLFFTMYADLYANVELNNNFILFDCRYFKILSIDDLNEDKLTLMYQCTERGIVTNEASNA